MFKQFITKILTNKILMGVGKITLITTVGITTATTGAHFYEDFSKTLIDPNQLGADQDLLLYTDQAPLESDEYDIETSTSQSKETKQNSSLSEFVVDIVTSASKKLSESVTDLITWNDTTDVNTSPSRQSSSVTVATSQSPFEDVITSSSRKSNTEGFLISVYHDDDDDDEYTEFEHEDEDDEDYQDDDDVDDD